MLGSSRQAGRGDGTTRWTVSRLLGPAERLAPVVALALVVALRVPSGAAPAPTDPAPTGLGPTPAPTAAPAATDAPVAGPTPLEDRTEAPVVPGPSTAPTPGVDPTTAAAPSSRDEGPPPVNDEAAFDVDGEGPLNEPPPPVPPSSTGRWDVPEAQWVFRFSPDGTGVLPARATISCAVSGGRMSCDPSDDLSGAAITGTLAARTGELVATGATAPGWGRLELAASSLGVGEDPDRPCELTGGYVHGADRGSWTAVRTAADC